jgi:hypothetical protein
MAIHRRLRNAAKSALTAIRDPRVRKPKGPRKAFRLSARAAEFTVDERLSALAAKALAGEHVECSWELFRLQYFPGWPNERVAEALGLWSTRTGVRVAFEGRTARNAPVIFVCFSC